jgi:hypothetical protein
MQDTFNPKQWATVMEGGGDEGMCVQCEGREGK